MTAAKGPQATERRPSMPPLTARASLRWDVVAGHVKSLHPSSILEIGCGRGAFGARLSRCADYLGLEPDPESYKAAAGNVAPQGGQVHNIASHELTDEGGFELVCAFEVLEHIEDDASTLFEWAGHIRPGGHFMLSVPAFQSRFGPMDVRAGHFRRYEPDQLEDLVHGTGLSIVSTKVYAWPLGYALEAIRNPIDARTMESAPAASRADLTAASGRLFQPSRKATGLAIAGATAPFRLIQRLNPRAGTGIVLVAQKENH